MGGLVVRNYLESRAQDRRRNEYLDSLDRRLEKELVPGRDKKDLFLRFSHLGLSTETDQYGLHNVGRDADIRCSTMPRTFIADGRVRSTPAAGVAIGANEDKDAYRPCSSGLFFGGCYGVDWYFLYFDRRNKLIGYIGVTDHLGAAM